MKPAKIVSMIHLGCPKNLVDTEKILGQLGLNEYALSVDPECSDIVLINTCGFIQSAREEAIDTIQSMLKLKQRKKVKIVIAVGCLVTLWREKLLEKLPGLDGAIGFCDYENISSYLRAIERKERKIFVDPSDFVPTDELRLRATPRNFSYLRITEGCSNCCSYCTIPTIRGRMRSKPMDRIIQEARILAMDGAKELIVIGQDTASYGRDLKEKTDLYELISRLSDVEGVRWIRIMYAHPSHIGKHFSKILRLPRVVPYLEMPIQHADPAILQAMKRTLDKEDALNYKETIDHLRAEVPGLVLRSTVMVGFPGETQERFESLLHFVETVKFERLGAFMYSREEGTAAASLPDQIDEETKKERYDLIMKAQQRVAFEWADKMVGKELDVVIEIQKRPKLWSGRSYGEAPDIDPSIDVRMNKARIGGFYRITITDRNGYDLLGVLKS